MNGTPASNGLAPNGPPPGGPPISVLGDDRRRTNLKTIWRNIPATVSATRRVLGLVWTTNRWLTLALATITLVRSFQPAAAVWVSKLLIDSVAAAVFAGGDSTQIPTVVGLVSIQLGLLAGNAMLQTLGNVCQQLLQEKVGLRVQLDVMQQADRLDLASFEDSTFYDRLQQAQREAAFRPVGMVSGLFGLVRTTIGFISMIALLVSLSPIIAIIALLAPVPSFVASTRYGWQGFQMMRRQSPMRRMMNYLTTVQTTDTFHKEVQIYNLGDYFISSFRTLSQRYYQEVRGLVIRRYSSAFALGLISLITTSGTYLYVALQAVAGRLTIGDIGLYSQAASTVQDNFSGILDGFSSLYESGLYLSTLFELLALEPKVNAPKHPVPVRVPFENGIEFDHVTFSYPGKTVKALDDVSFTIGLGETIAVVGKNGAGKTTLVKLLARLYDPQQGVIRIDGIDIRDYDPDDLRRQIGAMFQDYATYQLTVRENIGFGQIDSVNNAEAVAAAASRGGADSVISRFSTGYDTMLGKWFDGGQQLSGGEWQKVALSRAFMRDAQILVLDEPTAALDAQAEHDLFQRIRQLAEGRTAIYISHRFSTVRNADRIFVIDSGKLVEQGSHRELMARQGLYADLFELQAASYR